MDDNQKTTRIKILDSAYQELIEKGFAGFTINGVSHRAGISLGNLTYYFPSREKLIQAMIEQWFDSWKIEFARSIRKKINSPSIDIEGFIGWVMDYALAQENVRTFTELWAMANHEPKVAKMLQQLYEQAVDTVTFEVGLSTKAYDSSELRSLLYVLAAVSEGSTAVLGNSPKRHPQRKLLKQHVIAIMSPLLRNAIRQAQAEKKM